MNNTNLPNLFQHLFDNADAATQENIIAALTQKHRSTSTTPSLPQTQQTHDPSITTTPHAPTTPNASDITVDSSTTQEGDPKDHFTLAQSEILPTKTPTANHIQSSAGVITSFH
jgi:hypothetical protein